MLKTFLLAANAVFPIVFLILLGYILKRVGFLSREFLSVGNRLVFRCALPVLLFLNVYGIKGFSDIRFDAVLYSCAVTLIVFLVGFFTVWATVKDRRRRGPVWQCFYRSNFALIGLVLASALGGSEAEGVAAVLAAFVIPLFNILAVFSLTVFIKDEDGEKLSVTSFAKKIIKNPFVSVSILGFFVLFLRSAQVELFGEVVFSLQYDLPFVYDAMAMLKAMATPFALIVLGGQFEFSAVGGMKKEVFIGSIGRLVIVPLLGIGGAALLTHLGVFAFGVNEFPAFVALFGSPVAVSSAIMAGEMKNDGQLATQLLVWTSIFSIFTVFATVCILIGCSLLVV